MSGKKMDIPKVIETLKELADWLKGMECAERVNRIIAALEDPRISSSELARIKEQLSTKDLFNVRALGDIYVPDFVGDGTTYAWWNYLYRVAEICQENL